MGISQKKTGDIGLSLDWVVLVKSREEGEIGKSIEKIR